MLEFQLNLDSEFSSTVCSLHLWRKAFQEGGSGAWRVRPAPLKPPYLVQGTCTHDFSQAILSSVITITDLLVKFQHKSLLKGPSAPSHSAPFPRLALLVLEIYLVSTKAQIGVLLGPGRSAAEQVRIPRPGLGILSLDGEFLSSKLRWWGLQNALWLRHFFQLS